MQNYQFHGKKLKILDKSRKKFKKIKIGMEVLSECVRIEL